MKILITKLKTPPLDISVWESNAWMLGEGVGKERGGWSLNKIKRLLVPINPNRNCLFGKFYYSVKSSVLWWFRILYKSVPSAIPGLLNSYRNWPVWDFSSYTLIHRRDVHVLWNSTVDVGFIKNRSWYKTALSMFKHTSVKSPRSFSIVYQQLVCNWFCQ